MASLSNINGLFDVHSTGAILFSTSHGTTGQILRSNGNAAPTWVAASTVIGGPYLPIAGGVLEGPTSTDTGINFTVGGNLFVTSTSTLTGALSGTSATFSGKATFSDKIQIGSFISNDYAFTLKAASVATLPLAVFEDTASANGNGIVVNSVNTPNNYIADFKIGNVSKVKINKDGGIDVAGNVISTGKILLNANNINFESSYSGNGLVLSHHGVGPSNAIVSGNSVYPDTLFINNGGTTSDWSNVSITGNVVFGGNIYLPQSPGAIQGTGYPYTTYLGSGANATTTYIQAGSTFKTEIKLVGGDVGDFINFTAGNTERMRITSGGKTLIGITSEQNAGHLQMQSGTSENGGILDIAGGGWFRYYTRVCRNSTTAQAAGYWHIKTNIVVNSNTMFMAKFYGYIYGSAQILELTHAGYAYSGSNTVINQAATNNGSEPNANSVIYSSSNGNKVTFRIAFGTSNNFSTYFTGVMMDMAFPAPAGQGHDFEIEAQSFSQSTTVY